MKVTVIFGSNTGNRQEIIEKAISALALHAGEIMEMSSYYETEPWGFDSPEVFLNRIVLFDTALSPRDFLASCLQTEQQLGRVRHTGPRYQSRTIDIDILFYESIILNTPELTIPHPRITERNFVLIPLNELMPEFRHPVFNEAIADLLKKSPDHLLVKKLPDLNF